MLTIEHHFSPLIGLQIGSSGSSRDISALANKHNNKNTQNSIFSHNLALKHGG